MADFAVLRFQRERAAGLNVVTGLRSCLNQTLAFEDLQGLDYSRSRELALLRKPSHRREAVSWPDLPLADERNVFLRDALVDVHGSIMDLPKGANNIQFATFLANTVFCAFQSNRYSLTRDQPELDM